jgi:uncharacterized protein (TIGR02271 family)
MTKTLIGVFDASTGADNAITDLKNAGFHDDALQKLTGEKFLDEMSAEKKGGFFANVKRKLGFESGEYSTANIGPDDTVVMVDATDDDSASLAADILNRQGAVDLDTRGGAPEAAETGETAAGEERIPVTEEALRIGKRSRRIGGVRVYSHTTERPVEEEVPLKTEEIHVERRPVDRPASEAELAGTGETVEVTAVSEEPVIEKTARVKEEVVVSKTAGERVETVHETLRGTEVEVEQLSPEEEAEFATYEDELRSEAGSEQYDEMRPSYRYGYHLAQDPKFHDGSWENIEPLIRSDWEAHRYGPWDKYKSAVRSGWERGAHHPH